MTISQRHCSLVMYVDGVKVDNQSSLEAVSRGLGGRVELMRRRVEPASVSRAHATALLSLALIGAGFFGLALAERLPLPSLLFEAFSAAGTVGLSTGATPRLDGIGKIIIMWAMFIGRIGPMTLFMLLSEEHFSGISRCPTSSRSARSNGLASCFGIRIAAMHASNASSPVMPGVSLFLVSYSWVSSDLVSL